MLKKALLTVLLTASTLATAHINLNLTLTMTQQNVPYHFGTVIVAEDNVPTQIAFDDLENLVIGLSEQVNGEIVTVTAQLFEKLENDELQAVTEVLTLQVAFNQAAAISMRDINDSGDQLTLVITPSVI